MGGSAWRLAQIASDGMIKPIWPRDQTEMAATKSDDDVKRSLANVTAIYDT